MIGEVIVGILLCVLFTKTLIPFFLGKLVLKIPWKNLYNAPVEVSVEGLFLVLIPSREARYDAEKEEKWSQEGKQAVLMKVEEAKKKALERESEGKCHLLAESMM